MTIDEVKELSKQNMIAYNMKNVPVSQDAANYQLSIWAATLAPVPAPAAQAALMRAFTVCRFPVTLADLCNQLRAMQTEADPPAAALWDQISAAAHRANENKGLYSYTGRGADGCPIAETARKNNRAIFEELPAPARLWVGTLQALIDLDKEDSACKVFRHRDFVKFYDDYQKNRPLDPEKLAVLPCVTIAPAVTAQARPEVEA